jgi:hypothetical protein
MKMMDKSLYSMTPTMDPYQPSHVAAKGASEAMGRLGVSYLGNVEGIPIYKRH